VRERTPREEESTRELAQGEEVRPEEPEAPTGFLEMLRAVRQALAPFGRKRVFTASLGLAGSALLGVLLFSGVSFWWTSQPSFCARCHPMQKFVQAWRESPHAKVNCERCHTPPGLFGFLGGKIAGLQVVLDYVREEYRDWSFNAAVPNAACLQCHEEVLKKNLHAGDVVVSHKDIVSAGGKCMGCHSTVAHGKAVPVGSETHPSMAACLKCHNGGAAPLRCNLCHVGRAPSAAGKG
jgi:nitrate/TMAO reductase-like tetraheme cytochrome c subunit